MSIADSRHSSCSDVSDVNVNATTFPISGAPSSVSLNGSNVTMLRTLYEEMEPQISKSYRPHVQYDPPSKPATATLRLQAAVSKGRTKLKATQLMMQAVNEMQRKKAQAEARKLAAKEKAARAVERGGTPNKATSQSLPNLANGNS